MEQPRIRNNQESENNSEIGGKCKEDQLCNFSSDRKSYEEPDYADNAILKEMERTM